MEFIWGLYRDICRNYIGLLQGLYRNYIGSRGP